METNPQLDLDFESCCAQSAESWYEEFVISEPFLKKIFKMNFKGTVSRNELQSLTTMTLVHLQSSLQAARLIYHCMYTFESTVLLDIPKQ